MLRATVVTVAVLALTSCGSGDGTSGSTPEFSDSSAAASATADSHAPDVMTLASAMDAALADVVDVVEITEDNDVNNLIGRPGQYDSAAFLASETLGCSAGYDELSVDCGAKIERWVSGADANARAKDIQAKLKQYGLGAEWDYVSGGLLLRVSGNIPPSLASEYEAAFRAATS